MNQLKLDGTLKDLKKREYAVEAALLLGFQSETATFPVISEDGNISVPETDEELLALWTFNTETVPPDYSPAKKRGPLFELDFREKQGLENLFSRGMFLKDENNDFLPDKLDVKLILPENMDSSMLVAACNLAFRFGMETTAFEGNIIAKKDYEGNAVVLEYGEQAEVVLEELPNAIRVHMKGRGKELEDFSSLLCEKFPSAKGVRNWRDVLMDMTDDFTLREADGQLAYLRALENEEAGDYVIYGSPEIKQSQKKCFPKVKFYDYKAGKKSYEQTYNLPWELDVFEQELQKNVYPSLKRGDCVEIEGALSEDKKVRKELSYRILKEIKNRGAELKNIQLICAYKQGFSWLDEVVIPTVQKENPDRAEICFKPFLPKGQTQWLDEDGATPSYNNLSADDPDKWYDLPIRFLQELYPIEDVLVEKLGIPRENIVFTAYEGEEDITYLCQMTKEGNRCGEFRYLVRYSERPYLDTYPQTGKVHPSSGYLRVLVNGAEKVNLRIPTDLERIWDIYQKEVLPKAGEFVEQKMNGEIQTDKQPFFQKLVLEVSVSEPDYRAKSREDLISSLDALHEDLYFVGCDYFKHYGIQKADVLLDAPGLILPVIHNREGAPSFRVSLYERLAEKAYILRGEKIAACQREREEVSVRIVRIYFKERRLGVEIQVKGVPESVLKAYAELFSENVLELSRSVETAYLLKLKGENDQTYEMAALENLLRKKKKITDIDLHEKELIGYETYLDMIEELQDVDGIEVFQTARSYSGRKLYAIWLKPHYEGYLSMTKRLSRCPSEIINARHHANEVSSTNAAFILLKRILTEECYRELPEKLNLVLVPMENVDGAAIHYELQKEHPYWKLHVARFNAIGKEFYHDHFKQDTIHKEAMGFTRLFEKYVPDIIVDNHGVPSHEWEQPFSGYTSPSYKGFWLPRSLLYGYFWYVTNLEYQGNYLVNKKMEDVIADKIAENKEMRDWNITWSAQFEKYAHAWMPKLFPANYYKEMINYWIPFAFDAAHRYPSIRFPWITTVAYTSEVADETAQGEYLHLCARAHVAHDEATLQMLLESTHAYVCRCGYHENQIFAEYVRQRPMIVRGSEKR